MRWGRGRWCFPHCSATACRKPALIKCCVRTPQPSHIAVPRLNREQRIPHRKSTDTLAKGYNRKIHIKRRRCWRIRKFQSQYHRMSRWKEKVDWVSLGGVGGARISYGWHVGQEYIAMVLSVPLVEAVIPFSLRLCTRTTDGHLLSKVKTNSFNL